MSVGDPRSWVIFMHVLAVLGFVLFHGASAVVAFKLRGETEIPRIRALLDLSAASLGAMYGFFVLFLLAGIAAGFMGGWWTSGRLWIWASVLLLIGIVVAMYAGPTRYYAAVRNAVGQITPQQEKKGLPPPEPLGPAELTRLLASPMPIVAAVVGFGGLALILWLMLFKPF
jgi:hypothetical protein